MTIKQQGGIFGRNPTFNDVDVNGDLTISGSVSLPNDSISGDAIDGGSPTFESVLIDSDTSSTTLTVESDLDGSLFYSRIDLKREGTAAGTRLESSRYALAGGVGLKIKTTANNAAESSGTLVDRLVVDPTGLTSIRNNTTEVARFESSGNFYINNGNLKFNTSGSGIDFSATSGTGTSELFDDYEEGSFSPELLFGGSNTGMTYTNQDGVYTKVGNVVHFQIYIRLSAKGTSTGNTSITGLPFSTGFGYNVPAVWWTNMGTGLQPFVWAVGSSTTLIVQANNSGSSQNITNTSFTDTSRIVLSGTYRV